MISKQRDASSDVQPRLTTFKAGVDQHHRAASQLFEALKQTF
jgi:hypothetical protein